MSQFESLFPDVESVPSDVRVKTLEQREYLLDGRICQWSGPMQDVYSPIHIKDKDGIHPYRLGAYPKMDAASAMACLASSRRAWDQGRGLWPTLGVEKRIAAVEHFIREMVAVRSQVVTYLQWEICKNTSDAEKEFDRTVQYIRDTVDALKELDRASSRFHQDEGVLAQIRRSPLGVALCMGPFNYPLNETFTTLIPALIMGNPVIFKPAKHGALLFQPLLDAFRTCFPPGVVNTLYGEGRTVIPPLMESGLIDVFAFIGSSRVANTLEKCHPNPNRLRCVYGLGAKNPAIVLPDADLELTVKECLLGSLSYNGQRCTALKMLFVHEDVLTPFMDAFSSAVDALKIGLPWEKGVQITPLAEHNKVAYLNELLEDAKSKGARVINERGGDCLESLFFPAIVSPVNREMRLWHEEQFGPIVPVVPFKDLDTPIRYIEESPYGQQASVFGQDSLKLARIMDPLINQVCRINVNCQCQRGPDTYPFTGRKDSAEGTLSVSDALRVFSIRSLVAGKDNPLNRRMFTEITRERRSAFLSTDYLF